MTADRIRDQYQQLEAMQMNLQYAPELGDDYFRTQLLKAHGYWEVTANFMVEATRSMSQLRAEELSLKAIIRLLPSTDTESIQAKEQLTKTEAVIRELKFLMEAIRFRKESVRMAIGDVKLLVRLSEQARRMPERPGAPPVDPKEEAALARLRESMDAPKADVPAPTLILGDTDEIDPALLVTKDAPAATPVDDDLVDIGSLLG